MAAASLAGPRAPRAARTARASPGMFTQTQEVFKRGYIRGFEQVTCRGHNLFATPPCGTAPCTLVTRAVAGEQSKYFLMMPLHT